MHTLSLDLRGHAASVSIPDKTNPRSAGLSLLIHTLGISALILGPLMSATNPPNALKAARDILVRPVIEIALPAAPVLRERARGRTSARTQQAPAVSLQMKAPVDTPTSITPVGDVLDPILGTANGTGGSGEPGGVSQGGDCVLGALCGPMQTGGPEPPKEIVRITGGSIKEPRLIESRLPVYPEIARAAGVSGLVIIEAHVRADGRVVDTKVLRSQLLFDESALTSVRSRRYEPLLLNGVPTEFLITITVVFNLKR